jgi:TonB family protein
MQINKLSLATILLLSFSSLAEENKSINSQFKDAYHQYQTAIKANDTEAQTKYAKQSHELGKKVYGESDINTASLAINLASLYIDSQQYTQANALLLSTLLVYEKEYGKKSLEQIDIYFALAKSTPRKNQRKVLNYYRKILNISDNHKEENPKLNAQMQLDVGIELLSIGSHKSKVILEARDYFTKHLPSNDRRVVTANFFAGKYYLARKNLSKAIDAFEVNLPVFEALDGPTHPLELSTHAFLIGALERKGRSEEATKHCIAIGSMTPWDDAQKPTPLYRVNPKYPMNLARRGKSGYAVIEFIISDFGFVKNAKVLESKGGEGVEKESLLAIKNWRYAPRFENGKAVETTVSVHLDFKIN